MQYRDFGSSIDWEPSALGFGAMRLPTDEDGSVETGRAIEMIRTAIDNGVNYVDTAWPYHDVDRSPVEWALEWLWNQPEVSLVLSGMSTMEQVRENVEIAARSGVGQLTTDDLAAVERARDRFQALMAVDCTGCGECEAACPQNLAIISLLEEAHEQFETAGA